MKFIFLVLGLFFFGIGTTFSQTKEPKKTKLSNRKDDDCMLSAVYGQPLEITDHSVDSLKTTHPKTDYIQFNQDGQYLESINGKQSSGTWTYDSSAKTVKVECNGTHIYKLSTGPNGSFELQKPSAKMTIKSKS
jgi:hypothetical protein